MKHHVKTAAHWRQLLAKHFHQPSRHTVRLANIVRHVHMALWLWYGCSWQVGNSHTPVDVRENRGLYIYYHNITVLQYITILSKVQIPRTTLFLYIILLYQMYTRGEWWLKYIDVHGRRERANILSAVCVLWNRKFNLDFRHSSTSSPIR